MPSTAGDSTTTSATSNKKVKQLNRSKSSPIPTSSSNASLSSSTAAPAKSKKRVVSSDSTFALSRQDTVTTFPSRPTRKRTASSSGGGGRNMSINRAQILHRCNPATPNAMESPQTPTFSFFSAVVASPPPPSQSQQQTSHPDVSMSSSGSNSPTANGVVASPLVSLSSRFANYKLTSSNTANIPKHNSILSHTDYLTVDISRDGESIYSYDEEYGYSPSTRHSSVEYLGGENEFSKRKQGENEAYGDALVKPKRRSVRFSSEVKVQR
ncbi:uncharacterized protein LODBEIA_P35570 [Lodderomyces beijingensis]|uniref:Uncharacterized protein n=1 Tax=Lodderomyces beijingensis TaxID=1775926 RepID=A0ABP0ZNS0_9ASCO